MITVRTNLPEIARELQERAALLRAKLRRAVKIGTALIWADARARNNYAAGEAHPLPPPGPLRALTGMLLRSIASHEEELGDGMRGVIGTNLVYARIHELGGTIHQSARTHLPLKKGALTRKGKKFKGVKVAGKRGRQDLGARTFGARTITIPARPFLGPALERRRASVLARINAATLGSLRGEKGDG